MIINNIGINFAGGGGGGSEARLESKDFTLTQNGSTPIRPTSGYDGISGGTIEVNVDTTPAYNSGYTEGYASGYTSGETDGYATGYASGETAGIAEQKALLTSTTITENGSYTRENGWNAITVDVPQVGENKLNKLFTNTLTAVTQNDLSGATSIRDYAFYGCTNLKTVDLPASVNTLFQHAFDSSGIETLDVSNVRTFGNHAFLSCKSLTGLTGFENYTGKAQASMFEGCTALTGDFRTNMVAEVYSNLNKLFSNCKSLRSVTWLKNQPEVTHNSAFNNTYGGCTSMEYLDYTHNFIVPTLRFVNPFTAFTADYEIRVPQILYDEWTASTNWNNSAIVGHIKAYPNPYPTVVNRYTVTDDTKLTPIVAYGSSWGGILVSDDFDVTTGGTVSLYGDIVIPVDAYWSSNGSYKMKTYEIGDGVKSIGNRAFQYNYSLESITIPDSVTSIGEAVFFDCHALTSVTIGSGLTSIGNNAFAICNALTSISIPDNVTSIGSYIFQSCPALTSVTLSSNLSTIPEGFCYGCRSLLTITIPSGVTSIGLSAFANSGIKTIICNATIAPSLDNDAFRFMQGNGTLYVPAGSDYSSWLAKLPSGWTVSYI